MKQLQNKDNNKAEKWVTFTETDMLVMRHSVHEK
jgi:hypothetical protein